MIGRMVRKSLFRNIRMTIWTFATLTISAALVAMFATISLNMENKMGSALRKLGPNAIAVVRSLTERESFREIIKRENILSVELSLGIVTLEGQPVALAIADPEKLAQMTPYWIVMGRRARNKHDCLIGKRVAELLKLKSGMSITMDPFSGAKEKIRCDVTGIIVSGDENEDRIFVPGELAEAIPHDFIYALLSIPEGEKGIDHLNELLSHLQGDVEIKPLREIVHGEETTLKKVVLLSSTSLITVLILTVLGVSSALLSRIVERRKEFALLQAVGATRRSVVSFLMLEGIVLAVFASMVGFIMGTLLSEMVLQQIFHASVTPEIAALPITLIVTLAVSLLASSIGVIRTLKMQPALVLKGE